MRQRIQHLLFESELHLLFEDYRTDKIMQMVNKRLPEQDRLEQEELKSMIEADPPEELQLRTVNKWSLAYWYIKKPTRKVKELAIKRFREEGMEAEAESVESGEKGLYQM